MESKIRYNSPQYGKLLFLCPYCSVQTQMQWTTLKINNPHVSTAMCISCKKSSIWHSENMIYPEVGIAPPHHFMMPKCVLKYYEIARIVSRNLPVVACSFLRLAIRELFIILGENGCDFGEDIDRLIQRGFANRNFWKPMITSRLTGINSIKPGIIDQRDNFQVMETLFNFLNSIIKEVIENPVHLAEFYAKLDIPSNTDQKKIDPNFFQRS